jgi:hypothetical protein
MSEPGTQRAAGRGTHTDNWHAMAEMLRAVRNNDL